MRRLLLMGRGRMLTAGRMQWVADRMLHFWGNIGISAMVRHTHPTDLCTTWKPLELAAPTSPNLDRWPWGTCPRLKLFMPYSSGEEVLNVNKGWKLWNAVEVWEQVNIECNSCSFLFLSYVDFFHQYNKQTCLFKPRGVCGMSGGTCWGCPTSLIRLQIKS